MSPTCTKYLEVCIRFPRVSGDEPDDDDAFEAALVFSPRERG